MTTAEVARIKRKITTVLQAHASVAPARTRTLLPIKSLQGKLYEADVLANLCQNLVTKEGFAIKLTGGPKLKFKQKGGRIDRIYPHFEVWRGSSLMGEIFTDVYFDTLSYQLKGSPPRKEKGDYHELDIAMLQPNLVGHPTFPEVLIAVECKNTSIQKSIIREVLGFRRELSYLDDPQPTIFSHYPATSTRSNPNSVHMLFCSDRRVTRYVDNCVQFGIFLHHHKM